MRLSATTFARFLLRLDGLLELHREFRALNVHAVPPMRDDNLSNRGLGPKVACGTAGLSRLDRVLMNRSLRAMNSRPNID